MKFIAYSHQDERLERLLELLRRDGETWDEAAADRFWHKAIAIIAECQALSPEAVYPAPEWGPGMRLQMWWPRRVRR